MTMEHHWHFETCIFIFVQTCEDLHLHEHPKLGRSHSELWLISATINSFLSTCMISFAVIISNISLSIRLLRLSNGKQSNNLQSKTWHVGLFRFMVCSIISEQWHVIGLALPPILREFTVHMWVSLQDLTSVWFLRKSFTRAVCFGNEIVNSFDPSERQPQSNSWILPSFW